MAFIELGHNSAATGTELSAVAMVSAALTSDKQPKYFLDLPGVATLAAAGITKVGSGTTSFADALTDANYQGAASKGIRTGAKCRDPFGRYAAAVDKVHGLNDCLPEGLVKKIRNSWELRKSSRVIDDAYLQLCPTITPISNHWKTNPRPSVDVGVQTEAITITDDAGVPAANYTAALAKIFALPDVALGTYLADVNIRRFRCIVVFIFILKPALLLRYFNHQADQVTDYAFGADTPGQQNAMLTGLERIVWIALVFLDFRPNAPYHA